MNLTRLFDPARPLALGFLVGAFAVATDAEAKQVTVAEVTSSSVYPPEEGASYEAKRVIDGKISSCWVEGDEGSGLGSWVNLDLGSAHTVDKIKVWGGMWYSKEYWERGNRPKELEIKLDDDSKYKCEINDTMEAAVCSFKATSTQNIRVKVKATHSGSTWLDTAVSEIQVFDTAPNERVSVSAYDSSSKLPADADGNYEPANTNDGIDDTMWCEADKEGDGTGEFTSYTFDGTQKISKLHLLNGIGGSVKYWMLGNRATKATLEFSDGSKQNIEIKNSGRMQEIGFSAKSTSSVKITFTEIYKGKEYNDLCISEAYFTQ